MRKEASVRAATAMLPGQMAESRKRPPTAQVQKPFAQLGELLKRK